MWGNASLKVIQIEMVILLLVFKSIILNSLKWSYKKIRHSSKIYLWLFLFLDKKMYEIMKSAYVALFTEVDFKSVYEKALSAHLSIIFIIVDDGEPIFCKVFFYYFFLHLFNHKWKLPLFLFGSCDFILLP